MRFIRHRINKISELESIDKNHGVEIDLRSDLSQISHIHLSHDPWVRGDSLNEWIKKFSELNIKGPIIFNTKEDGLEEEVMRVSEKYSITNYFFLDTAIPTLIANINKGFGSKFCCRFSSYENWNSLIPFIDKVPRLWVDCFSGVPLEESQVQLAKEHFDLIFVSPELQKVSLEKIYDFTHLKKYMDYVCTKRPELWQ